MPRPQNRGFFCYGNTKALIIHAETNTEMVKAINAIPRAVSKTGFMAYTLAVEGEGGAANVLAECPIPNPKRYGLLRAGLPNRQNQRQSAFRQ